MIMNIKAKVENLMRISMGRFMMALSNFSIQNNRVIEARRCSF